MKKSSSYPSTSTKPKPLAWLIKVPTGRFASGFTYLPCFVSCIFPSDKSAPSTSRNIPLSAGVTCMNAASSFSFIGTYCSSATSSHIKFFRFSNCVSIRLPFLLFLPSLHISRLEMLRISRSRCSSGASVHSLTCKHDGYARKLLTLLIRARKHPHHIRARVLFVL